jgi:tRNA G18 (ribose-2'-O)-methylase SpoU
MKRNVTNRGGSSEAWIYGVHPVMEALTHKKEAVRRLMLKGEHREIEEKASGISIRRITDEYVPQGVSRHAVHQGVFALVQSAKLTVPYKDFIETVDVTENTSFVLLDEITDPQNVGAIIRSSTARDNRQCQHHASRPERPWVLGVWTRRACRHSATPRNIHQTECVCVWLGGQGGA